MCAAGGVYHGCGPGAALPAARGAYGDRFAGVGRSVTENGAALLDGAAVWLECEIHDVSTGGDHEPVLPRVLRHRTDDDATPLVSHAGGFHKITALNHLNGVA
ncbi:flavin reductase family protein [Streptosporangium amethystogenes]|uniref:flavin reductase family protein n=1 Tax=Streptosporangium amethystogenes TaxID=2002 RepID=UPI00379F96EC